ncbi:AAA family ATPase [Lentzea flaviverrucosa]|uniref:ABC-2 type transport system ATP-binding protein n=1 Tax=Lentzea flaviverrucosa TaxID=200379 RepID=A0A1H9XWG5_9PSEU|nr:AAA family ATPase [Lentzea flaviverrucosa]RDI34385.1 putative AbiEii toxin of type IV toxin-antitoxin system [Lentzea flaviverrucosa]SES50444.1 ABC-2 type transport system ATP-binding protein [Lentzea flaviverrucosa]
MSLGNAQRLGLAKALLHRPELLVLDEPANGLDPAGVAEIRDLLHELSQEHGVSVVLSSHILTEVARLATRIGVIHCGRLVRELDAHVRRRLSVSARDRAAAERALEGAGFRPSRRSRTT